MSEKGSANRDSFAEEVANLWFLRSTGMWFYFCFGCRWWAWRPWLICQEGLKGFEYSSLLLNQEIVQGRTHVPAERGRPISWHIVSIRLMALWTSWTAREGGNIINMSSKYLHMVPFRPWLCFMIHSQQFLNHSQCLVLILAHMRSIFSLQIIITVPKM